MTYCMSDVHGELDRWNKMLKLIRFSDTDTLYYLGDAIDRKPHGVKILQDIMQRPNVRMVLGNQEQMMLDSFWSDHTHDALRLWKRNGGSSTYKAMTYKICPEERLRILRYIQELPDHLEMTINGQAFYLVHGYIGESREERIWGRPEPPPKETPIPGKTVIVGHTPTYFMNQYGDTFDETAMLKIFYAPGLIDLDCGCGHIIDQRRLACLRLEDMMEFYV